MSHALLLSLLSVLGVSLLSLLGVLLFFLRDAFLTRILLYLVSFSTGALLGDVFIHMLPGMAENASMFPQSCGVILLGILFSFVVEKVVHWRHCHVIGEHHDHHHPVGILSLVGESLHNCIDGVIIAAAYLASPAVGLATTLAVIFHEIPHEIGNVAILLHSGYSRKQVILFNALIALTSFLGVLLVAVASASASNLALYALPFAAGNLLYIAGSDLIPELHKQTQMRGSILQLFGMIAGMAVMYAIVFVE